MQISATVLRIFVEALEALGIDRRKLLTACEIEAGQLEDPDARIPQDRIERVWLVARELSGDPRIGLHAGERIRPHAVNLFGYLLLSSATLGVDTLDVLDVVNANLAITALDLAIDTATGARGGLGAAQNRMNSALASILVARENLSAAESRIRDVDVASETADLARNTIMQQAAVSVLQQANLQPQIALSLLQG